MTRIVQRVAGPAFDVPEWTLVDVLRRAAREHGDKPAFLDAEGRPLATWSDVLARVERVAQGLVALGLRPGDRVAVVSDTRAEWVVADHAILMAGGTTVSAFRSFAPATLVDVIRTSGARFAFVEDVSVLEKAKDAEGVQRWILFEEGPVPEPLAKRTLTFGALRASTSRDEGELERRAAAVQPDDVAAIIYTSGTTGVPKGAMLTHRNLVSNSLASIQHLGLQPHPVGLAFLPIAHSYQRQSGVVVALLAGSVAFSSPSRLAKDLPRVRPTLFPAVPRLYERLFARIEETARALPAPRRRVFSAACAVARAVGRSKLEGRRAPLWLRVQHALFDGLVYAKVRKQAGLDRLDLAITGAAPMRRDLLEFFWGIGIPIAEGYGLTESAAPSTVNAPGAPRAGTVGTPLPGTQVALAEDGEVLLAGPHIFAGYDRMPEETREAIVEIDGERWLLTGDIGAIEGGALRIVDRKKELEVLDTGKKVAPSPIEERLKASDLVGEAVLVADGRKFVACLVQPDYEALLRWADTEGIAYDKARTRHGIDATGERGVVEVDAALLRDPRVVGRYQQDVDRVNAVIAEYERIQAFRLLPTALSADRGEITPTLKKRRKVILRERAEEVEALFNA